MYTSRFIGNQVNDIINMIKMFLPKQNFPFINTWTWLYFINKKTFTLLSSSLSLFLSSSSVDLFNFVFLNTFPNLNIQLKLSKLHDERIMREKRKPTFYLFFFLLSSNHFILSIPFFSLDKLSSIKMSYSCLKAVKNSSKLLLSSSLKTVGFNELEWTNQRRKKC